MTLSENWPGLTCSPSIDEMLVNLIGKYGDILILGDLCNRAHLLSRSAQIPWDWMGSLLLSVWSCQLFVPLDAWGESLQVLVQGNTHGPTAHKLCQLGIG